MPAPPSSLAAVLVSSSASARSLTETVRFYSVSSYDNCNFPVKKKGNEILQCTDGEYDISRFSAIDWH